jgi:hypothetical protein
MRTFLGEDVPRNWRTYCDQITDNFRVITPTDFRIIASPTAFPRPALPEGRGEPALGDQVRNRWTARDFIEAATGLPRR